MKTMCVLGVQELLETQMGMSLPDMRAFCQSDPATSRGRTLPGAHLPSKGFWLLKRPTAPSTAAAPSPAGRFMRKVPFKSSSKTSQHSSDDL